MRQLGVTPVPAHGRTPRIPEILDDNVLKAMRTAEGHTLEVEGHTLQVRCSPSCGCCCFRHPAGGISLQPCSAFVLNDRAPQLWFENEAFGKVAGSHEYLLVKCKRVAHHFVSRTLVCADHHPGTHGRSDPQT